MRIAKAFEDGPGSPRRSDTPLTVIARSREPGCINGDVAISFGH
jgi:hypothetical protein